MGSSAPLAMGSSLLLGLETSPGRDFAPLMGLRLSGLTGATLTSLSPEKTLALDRRCWSSLATLTGLASWLLPVLKFRDFLLRGFGTGAYPLVLLGTVSVAVLARLLVVVGITVTLMGREEVSLGGGFLLGEVGLMAVGGGCPNLDPWALDVCDGDEDMLDGEREMGEKSSPLREGVYEYRGGGFEGGGGFRGGGGLENLGVEGGGGFRGGGGLEDSISEGVEGGGGFRGGGGLEDSISEGVEGGGGFRGGGGLEDSISEGGLLRDGELCPRKAT